MKRKNEKKQDRSAVTGAELFLKGMAVGGTMTLPGVSGGTMAMLLGIYECLIRAVSGLIHDPRGSVKTLVSFGMGGCIGLLLFARVSLWLLERYPIPVFLVLLAGVVTGLGAIVRESGLVKASPGDALWLLAGVGGIRLLALLPEGYFVPGGGSILSFAFSQLSAGVLLAAALVLPGISTSHILLVLGLYEPVLTAISEWNILSLLPLIAGGVAGTILCAGALEYLMEKYPKKTGFCILGFVLASLWDCAGIFL